MTAYTTEQIIEAMARAIDPAAWDLEPTSPNQNVYAAARFKNCLRRQRKATRQARAAVAKALELLAEPTEAMNGRGWDASLAMANRSDCDEPAEIWRAMIQARREELG